MMIGIESIPLPLACEASTLSSEIHPHLLFIIYYYYTFFYLLLHIFLFIIYLHCYLLFSSQMKYFIDSRNLKLINKNFLSLIVFCLGEKKKKKMRLLKLGIEPRLVRPQHTVLTTMRFQYILLNINYYIEYKISYFGYLSIFFWRNNFLYYFPYIFIV